MSGIKTDLTALGFQPQLEFRTDSNTKILYLRLATGAERMTATGSLRIPTVSIASQNKTLKNVTSGVRFFLVRG